jgi:hypothetical protein
MEADGPEALESVNDVRTHLVPDAGRGTLRPPTPRR